MMPRSKAPTVPYQVDTRGRVALAPHVKAALEVGPGDFVTYEVDGKTVRIRKVKISVE
jgi:hypothetical protein